MGGAETSVNIVDWALQYAGRGWRVFPLHSIDAAGRCTCGRACDSPGKHPLTKQGFKDASTDPAVIEAWWRKWPWANIGIATGQGLVVLDIDGAEGLAELKALVARQGRVPATLTARTGNGAHLFFIGGEGIKSSARGNLHVRGEGGYVVAAPSKHASGRTYQWTNQVTAVQLEPWLREWMQSGGNLKESASAQLQRIEAPKYLERLSSGEIAARAIQALSRAESTWSPQEQKRIESALKAIPAVNHQIWLDIGMALHSLQWFRSDGTEIGLEIWDEWSQTSPNNYPGIGGLEVRWRSFGRRDGPGKTIATLFHYAKAHNWDEMEAAPIAPGEVNGRPATAILPAGLSEPTHSQKIYFDLNDSGFPKSTAKNARAAIMALGIACAHDTFHDRMTVGGNVLNQFVGEISDNTVHVLRVMIEQHYRFDPKLDNLHAAVVELALQNQYDPVADYLDSVEWDGAPRVATWLTRYLGAGDTRVTRAMGRAVLVAAVRRVYEPGTKFDQIIVLEGPEGRNKSTAIRILAGNENFSDQTILTLNDRQQQEQMEGVWLYEIADLTGISRAEVEKVKAFASRQVDRARAAYARKRTDRPRRCIFFATTNEQTYLASQTGNRRFWPIACGHIDVVGLRADRDQLWAEACEIEARGESIELGSELWGDARELQDARREVDPWDVLLEGLEGHHCTIKDWPQEWRITTKDLTVGVLQIPADRQYAVTAKRLVYAMQRLGWDGPKLLKMEGNVARGYTKRKSY